MSREPVLVVEDTPVSSKVLKVLLSRHGYDVQTASSAEEALQVLETFRPRIILTDIQLPGMDGLDLVRRLKSNPVTRDTVVLAVTAFAMKSDEQKALEAGCDGYITKPIDAHTFPKLIQQYLKQGGKTMQEDLVALSADPADTTLCLRDLQRRFAAEGIEESERLLGTLDAAFDSRKALVTAHRWAGAAGSIGYPQITQAAREFETVLQQNGCGSTTRTREMLTELAGLFGDALNSEPESRSAASRGEPTEEAGLVSAALGALSAHQEAYPAVLATLAGKRIALAGFPPEQAARLARVLEGCQAFSRDLGTLPDAEKVRLFDAVIVNVGPHVDIPQWNKPVLMIGPREILLQQRVQNAEQDFLFAPWTDDEFTLRLYFVISRAPQGHLTQPSAFAGGRRRVVVADDDSTICAILEASLRNAGLECRVAHDGGAALELILSWQPDLAVLDVNMPSRSGYEVLSTLRSDPVTREMRVILLTARQQETDVIRGFGLGADDYVIKPFSPMELIARMKRLLGKNV